MKNKLTPRMVEVLTKSLEKDGDMRITNARLKNSLLGRGYIELAMGYGYGFGGIQAITPAGREALREHQAFQQARAVDLPPAPRLKNKRKVAANH